MKLANLVSKETPIGSLESIDYHINDKFGFDLEFVVSEFTELVRKGTPSKYIEGNKELKQKLADLIYKRTGIKIYLITDKFLASTVPNAYTPNNALYDTDIHEELQSYMIKGSGSGILYDKANDFSLGTVDNKQVKITGWFSDQTVPLFINFRESVETYKLTDREITANILHELGHIFQAASMSSRINSTNQTLSAAVRRSSNLPIEDKREFIFKELNNIDPNIDRETIEGLSSPNPVVYGVSAFRCLMGSVKSLSESDGYDKTSFEAISDSFATRFGYGEALVTGLDKSNKLDGLSTSSVFISYQQLSMIMSSIASISVFVISLSRLKGLALLLGFKVILTIISLIGSTYFMVFTQRESQRNMTYDLDKDRMIRIRNDMVGILKEPGIDIKTKKAALSQIKVVTDIIEKTPNIRGLIQRLSILVNKTDRNFYNAIKTQQEVEKMIANDIFVSASKLKTQ